MRSRVFAAVLALALAGVASAQDFQFMRGPRRARFATPASFDGTFNFCRLFYTRVRTAYGGQGWWTDYPDADTNFMIRLSELTKTRVSHDPDGQPNHVVVRADDESIFQCPFVTIEDAGTARFSDAEVAGLRNYLLKGGFLWADDFWGTEAFDYWRDELARVLPESEYRIIDLTPSHPIFRMLFEFNAIPQIPSINHWYRSSGETSELGYDSAEVHLRAITDARGRVMVLITHNTDIADAWEREAQDPRYFYLFSPKGYAVGINILL
ncbi:MAG TPA: DUF4159 domain-containing protein, partial [Vicinamibacterales bacterium]|nr:DUF4159 domain-containing protein [Vicinamibacterales bacterium]